MNARNRVFVILGLLTVGSLVWYLLTTRRTSDLQLIGTVDANEVDGELEDSRPHSDADRGRRPGCEGRRR